ncbi:DnaJ domain containing protein [Tritrichomonas foetus]|uniref:DnaJ domain containing protein n=1 Tax=Tritrichomonas foetus TaxID=1144522 RepID=A0A1J4JPA1_9EUKA|nr:DnaJ domain containing protein [Tritrichomonas foetus]|eukprot:OHS99349.1 DnaJ domain containing protein [Tritrichomonas foetus]
MVVDTKLYDLLGVSPDVSDRELKKAFMQKARQLHPDKNRDDPNATEKFQQVNEAYEILKDPQKRQIYDQAGVDGLREGAGGMGGGFDDILSHLFGGGFGFGGGARRQQRRPRTQDIGHKINVTLEDLYSGKEVTLRINRDIICPDCKGSGCANGKSPKKCPDCGGRGQKVNVVKMGPMITQQVGPCPTCRGAGESIDPADKCKKCKGKKVTEEKKTIVVHIEPGMEDGDKIPFQGCADEAPGADTGDLVVMLSLKKHDHFLRKHDDLLMMKRISLSEALLGTKFVLKHLDGRQLVVSTPPGQVVIPDSVKVIDREGMPRRGNQFEKGRLFIKFNVEFPKPAQLTPEFKAALAACLPPPNEVAGVDLNDDNVYEVSMKESDLKQFENSKSTYRNRRGEAYDAGADYDDDERGGTSASCQPM